MNFDCFLNLKSVQRNYKYLQVLFSIFLGEKTLSDKLLLQI